MNPQAGVWGIDLGQCGLKAMRLQEIDGQVTATAFDYVEHPKILSQPDADPDQLTREALDKFLSRNSLRGDTVAISVPGQSGLARFVKLPPVEEKKIADIVRFEAKQQIPFNLDEVVWDFQKIGSGLVTDGFAMETEIGLFAMKRDLISSYLQHFTDVEGRRPRHPDGPAGAVQLRRLRPAQKEAKPAAPAPEGETSEPAAEIGCVVALDIGTDTTNLVITDGDKVIWQRPIPLGGNHFTRALTKDLKLTFAKAEHLKRNATKSPDLRKILASLKPVLNDFVSEVQRSLGYFTNTHRDAQIEYMVGLGNAFRLPGLQKFLEEKLGMSVRKLQKMERLTGDAVLTAQVYTENILTFAVAYGLALQGLQRAKLLTNLLPPEIRTERLIRAKKPWAAAAAAALLIGLAGMMAGYGLNLRSYKNAEVTAAIESVGDTAKKANEAKSKFTAAQDKAEKEEESVKSIVAGQGEFLNWLEFISFISKAIPQPDGTNLPESARQKYWVKKPAGFGAMSGEDAFEAYMEQQTGLKRAPMAAPPPPAIPGNPRVASATSTPAVEDLPPGIDNLIQVNVEAVDARFLDDMAGFWRKVRTRPWVKPRATGGPSTTPTTPPTKSHGAGWSKSAAGLSITKRGNSSWTPMSKTSSSAACPTSNQAPPVRPPRAIKGLRPQQNPGTRLLLAQPRPRPGSPNQPPNPRGPKKNPCATASATSCSTNTRSCKPPTPGRST